MRYMFLDGEENERGQVTTYLYTYQLNDMEDNEGD